jgi:hypothetical protein
LSPPDPIVVNGRLQCGHGPISTESRVFKSGSGSRPAKSWCEEPLRETLIENGYPKGTLKNRIDEAAKDGVITAARQKRAHDDVGVWGNHVLHDEWQWVAEGEYAAAHLHAQKILEDFYDSSGEVEQILGKLEGLPRRKS